MKEFQEGRAELNTLICRHEILLAPDQQTNGRENQNRQRNGDPF